MLFKILDHIRTKPEQTRKQYAFFTALSITLVIGGIWAFTLPARFVTPVDSQIASSEAPFASMWGQIRDQFGQLKSDAAAVTSGPTATTSVEDSATSTFDAVMILASTSNNYIAPEERSIPVLIGTTSATTTN